MGRVDQVIQKLRDAFNSRSEKEKSQVDLNDAVRRAREAIDKKIAEREARERVTSKGGA